MNKFFSKKKAAGAVAVVAVVAMLLTGTFAYVLNNQHRDDYLNTENRIYDLTLLNNFTSYDKTSWNENENVANPISVKSMPNTVDETYTNAYVAVQLMEYINVYNRGDWLTVGDVKSTADTTQALFAIDTNGDYMTHAAATAKFGTANIVSYTQDGRTYALINGSQTAADKNAALGINGKPMRSEKDTFIYGETNSKKGYDDVKANGASPVPNDRCDSDPVQGWSAVAGKDARDYVSFELDSNVMKLSDWQAKYAANANDPTLTGDFWIIGDNGWAYYAKPLAPNAKTADLLKNLKLEKSVSSIDYYMHVDMASASIDQIDVLKGAKSAQGANMPANMVTFFKAQANYNAGMAAKEDALNGLITDPTSPVEEGAKVDDVNGVPMIVDGSGNVYVIPENIPDSAVLDYINDNFATDGKLTAQDIENVTTMTLENSTVADLTGISIFKNLDELKVSDNPTLTTIDVSLNSKLETLEIQRTGITEIDLSQNIALVTFTCGSSKLNSIDVSNNVNIEVLKLGTNNLTSIDVSKNLKLKELQVHSNQLTSLDVSNNVALDRLTCNGNQLTSLNFKNNTSLSYINASNNLLTAIDVSHNSALTDLRVNGNQLTSLDLSNNVALEMLYAYDNQIGTLDVSTTAIMIVNNCRIQNNNMTSLLISTAQNAVTNFGKSSSYQKAGNPALVVTVK